MREQALCEKSMVSRRFGCHNALGAREARLMRELEQRVALVTGAGSGIGRAVACELARSGALVVASDLSLEGAADTAREIQDLGATAVVRHLDVTSESEVMATVADVSTSVGPISLLINCAGISTMARFVDLTEQDWDRTMDVNAKGVFLVTREVVRSMISRRDGCVVSIASAAAKEGTPLLAHYSASKWAVLGLTQSVAREVAPFGVRVNAVCPGCVRTPMQDREIVWEGQLRGMEPEDVRQSYIAHTPLGRLCEPQDVADVIAFLCSDKARFMTGQAVNVTGGIVLH
jgi:meso-butanediol dehydrogenase / (S,S)-butanediol dehydrogenase / diacetyl reductase